MHGGAAPQVKPAAAARLRAMWTRLWDRYKVLYGGRGGIKSWSVAQFLLYMGTKKDLRIPCARETMQSIRESVHQLLEDQITRLVCGQAPRLASCESHLTPGTTSARGD